MMFNLEGHLRPLLFIVVWQLCKSWTFLRTTSLVRDKHYELNKVKKYSATDCVKYLFDKLYQYIWFTCRDSYLIYLYIQDQPIVTWENAEETEEEEEEEDKMMEKSTTFLSDNAKKATGLYRSTKVSVYQMVIVEE